MLTIHDNRYEAVGLPHYGMKLVSDDGIESALGHMLNP